MRWREDRGFTLIETLVALTIMIAAATILWSIEIIVAKRLLVEAKVAVSPGIGFGEHGEGYVRIALVENEQRVRQAARNVRRFLSDVGRNSKAMEAAK